MRVWKELELHDRKFVSGAFSQADHRNCVIGNLCASRISSESNLNRASCEQPVRGTPSEQDFVEAPKLLRASSASRTSSEFVRKSFRHGQTFVAERGSSESNFRAELHQIKELPRYTQPLSRADRRQSRSSVRAEHRQSRLRPRHSARLVSVEQELCQVGLRRNGDSSNRTSSAATREVRQNGTVSEWSFVRAES